MYAFEPEEYFIASDYTCLISVSTNHSPFIEAAAVSEYE